MVVGACIQLRGEWSRVYIEVLGRGKPEAAEEDPKEEAIAALGKTPVAVPAEVEVECKEFVDSRRRNQQVLMPQVALGSNLGCHRWLSAASWVSGIGDSSPVPEAEPGAAEEEPRRGCPALVEEEVESKAWVSGIGGGRSREQGVGVRQWCRVVLKRVRRVWVSGEYGGWVPKLERSLSKLHSCLLPFSTVEMKSGLLFLEGLLGARNTIAAIVGQSDNGAGCKNVGLKSVSSG